MVLRIGNFIEKFNAASTIRNKNGPVDPVLRYLTAGHHRGYQVYIALDTLVFINSIGARKLAITKSLQKSGYRAWMAGLICSAIAGIYSLCRLYQKEQKADRKLAKGAVEAKRIHRERLTTSAQLTSSLWDMAMPISTIGLAALDDGFVGVAGTLSSLVDVWFQWRKTASSEPRRR